MADLEYSISDSKLSWNAKGLSWEAVSGPFGNGALPVGNYIVKRNRVTSFTDAIASSYRDPSGEGFFLPLEPQFETTRSGFGIHPDGGVPGTLGCIGLKGSTKSFYDALAGTPFQDLTLEVKN